MSVIHDPGIEGVVYFRVDGLFFGRPVNFVISLHL